MPTKSELIDRIERRNRIERRVEFCARGIVFIPCFILAALVLISVLPKVVANAAATALQVEQGAPKW